jgi:hypothetical protein
MDIRSEIRERRPRTTLALMRLSVVLIVSALALLVAAPAQASGSARSIATFQSPSGNIGCAMSRSFGVRCDIRNKTWQAPPKPASCELDWGFGLNLDRRGRATFVCAGDTVLGQGRHLPFGQSIRRGRFVCRSKRIGMRCINLRNGHGFLLSREVARRF